MTTTTDSEGTPGELADSGDIAGALHALDESLKGIGWRMDRKFGRNLMVMGLLAVVIVVLAWSVHTTADSAHDARRDARKAQTALSSYIDATQVARVAACQNSNVSELKQAAAEKIESHDFVAGLIAGSTDPAVIARGAAFNATHDLLITGAHSLRDCTAAGIAKFLNQHPPGTTTTTP